MRWLGHIGLVVAVVLGGACDDGRTSSARAVVSSVPPSASTAPIASASSRAAADGLPPLIDAAVKGATLLLDKADKQEDVRVRPRMAAGVLEELEERRLPARVVAALAAASERRVERARRAKVVWEGISNTPDMLDAWNAACHAGPFHDGGRIVVILFGRESDPRKRSAEIFGSCRLEDEGLITLSELTDDFDLVMLAHALKAYLAAHGGAHPVETRALRMLARGGRKPSPAFTADELPTVENPKRLAGSAEKVVQASVAAGRALLEAGNIRRFFTEIVHPHELGGLRVEDAVRTFSKKGKTKPLLEAFVLATGRPARDEGEGEASVPLPWRPGPDARERLRFQLHEGKWYLRL